MIGKTSGSMLIFSSKSMFYHFIVFSSITSNTCTMNIFQGVVQTEACSMNMSRKKSWMENLYLFAPCVGNQIHRRLILWTMWRVFTFQTCLHTLANIVEKLSMLKTVYMYTYLLITDLKSHLINLNNDVAGSGSKMFLNYVEKSETSSGWKCTVCGKESAQKQNLVKHIESVHFPGLFSYECKFCGKTFKAKNNLYFHVASTHKNQWSSN